jgi:DNA polymerase (family 10)
MNRIDRLNGKLHRLTLLKGAEVDIRRDGSLDLPDGVLEDLDLVCVSLHSQLDLPEREQTRRVLKALGHPSVDVFGHPTGRLLGKRPGARFDFSQALKVARGNGILFEINAQPERLDLDEIMVRATVEAGVKLTVSTDAHATVELGFMRWGVDQARRGWAERKDVANTLPLERLLKLLHGARGR